MVFNFTELIKRRGYNRPANRSISVTTLVTLIALLCTIGCTKDEATVPGQSPSKDRIVADPIRVLPVSSITSVPFAKAGHWVQTKQAVTANHNDENLSLIYSQRGAGSTELPEINFTRSSSVAKRETKNIEGSMFLFEGLNRSHGSNLSSQNSTRVDAELADKRLGTTLSLSTESVQLMEDYQTAFVILAGNADTQSFWNRTSVVNWPKGILSGFEMRPFRCVPIGVKDIPDNFPSNFYGLSFTSTIYWHDVPANTLSEDQKSAIIDWLHFGGRLIVNGPQTIAALSNSFLSPYLPLSDLVPSHDDADTLAQTMNSFSLDYAAEPAKDEELTQNPLLGISTPDTPEPEVIDEAVAASERAEALSGPQVTVLETQSNVSAAMIKSGLCKSHLASNGTWVPGCEGLLAETRVGRGRVCMSTFDMASDEIGSWASYGSFLHSAVFRLPSRQWQSSDGAANFAYAGPYTGSERSQSIYSNIGIVPYSRDSEAKEIRPEDFASDSAYSRALENRAVKRWNVDRFNSVALSDIQQTSGIKIPPVDSLGKMIGVYLLILVPANWCVFRLANRLEWAWFCIPAIAVVSAASIAYQLQIQIGFARSQNSVAWLQLQSDYSRANLARHTSLYSSLSTRFAFSLPNSNGYVLPVSKANRLSDAREFSYSLQDDRGSGLRNTPVRSHTSGLFQSEEIVDIGGEIEVDRSKSSQESTLSNNSIIHLQEVVWVHWQDGAATYRWVGDLLPSHSVSIDDTRVLTLTQTLDEIRSKNIQSADQNSADVDISSAISNANVVRQMMTEYLESAAFNGNGDLVVGWTQNVLSSLAIQPEPSQRSDQTLVTMHFAQLDGKPLNLDHSLPPRSLTSKKTPLKR